jgi:hypothetical protein
MYQEVCEGLVRCRQGVPVTVRHMTATSDGTGDYGRRGTALMTIGRPRFIHVGS